MADCSTNANPLARLNKHTLENKHFHQSGQSFGDGRMGLQQEMFQNAFMNAQANTQQQQQQPQLGFMDRSSASPVARHKPMVHQNNSHISNIVQGGNTWKTEFQSQSAPNLMELQQQRAAMSDQLSSYTQNVNNQGYAPTTNMMTPMMMSSSLNLRPSPMTMMNTYGSSQNFMQNSLNSNIQQGKGMQNQHDQSTTQEDSTKWEEKFSELERQVESRLTLQENQAVGEMEKVVDAEDTGGVVESFDQVKFEQVWEDLQQQKKEMENSSVFNNSVVNDDDEYYQSYYNMYTNKPSGAYKFASVENNQYYKNPNAYEMGIILMEQGAKLSEAILCFEAAIQEDETHLDAWMKLGQCNIANELEVQGIAALEKVIELEPLNMEAMMSLSVSYINEGYDLTAYNMLSNWLQVKYKESLTSYKPVNQDSRGHNMSVLEKTLNKFRHILSNNGRSMAIQDREFQLGLGLLYYTKGDFDQTIDCFQTALEAQPDDEIMWNRLGATLANANRCEDAIHAYKQALQLKPTFVRARYNLAVACINIGCYQEAAEHLLGALSLHEVESNSALGPQTETNSTNPGNVLLYEKYSANIMETLKRSFIAMNRRDLLEKVGPAGTKLELTQFRSEFDF